LISNWQTSKSTYARTFINYFDTLPAHLLQGYFNTLDHQTQIEFRNTMVQKDQLKNELFIERFNEWALHECINAVAPFERSQGSDDHMTEEMNHKGSINVF